METRIVQHFPVPTLFLQREQPIIGDPQKAYWQAYIWLSKRPAFVASNREITRMAPLMVNESFEPEIELQAWGKPNFSAAQLKKEMMDTFFFPSAYDALNNQVLDMPSLASKLNGRGRRSDSFESYREVIGNLPFSTTPDADLQYALGLYFSILRHLPVSIPFSIMNTVLLKNSRNYPAAYFKAKHPVTNQPLDEDGLHQVYTLEKDGLRVIRTASGNSSEGLRWQDHELFYKDWMTIGPEDAYKKLLSQRCPI